MGEHLYPFISLNLFTLNWEWNHNRIISAAINSRINIAVITPQRWDGHHSPTPHIWFRYMNWWCHICTKEVWRDLLVMSWGFLGRAGQASQAGPKVAWKNREISLALLLFWLDDGAWGQSSHLCFGPGLGFSFPSAPKEGSPGFSYQLPLGKGDCNSLKVVSKHQILYYKYIFKCLSLFILWGKNVVSVLSKHH